LVATSAIPEEPVARSPEPRIRRVLPQDAIPAIHRPVFVTRAEAEPMMSEDEPVLGVVDPVSGVAKAYSLWQLDRHEIVNDRLGEARHRGHLVTVHVSLEPEQARRKEVVHLAHRSEAVLDSTYHRW
jgi:hypothetical protein